MILRSNKIICFGQIKCAAKGKSIYPFAVINIS